MLLSNTVYNNRDNVISLSLLSDGVVINHTSITRVQLKVGTVVLDSQTNPTWFDLTNASKITLKLGFASLTTGRSLASLIIFDVLHPDGVVWGKFQLTVEDI